MTTKQQIWAAIQSQLAQAGIGGNYGNQEIHDWINEAIKDYAEEHHKERLLLLDVSGSLRYSEHEIDFAYLAGIFNVSGIDGLQKEIERLKGLGKNPHDIIIAARGQ